MKIIESETNKISYKYDSNKPNQVTILRIGSAVYVYSHKELWLKLGLKVRPLRATDAIASPLPWIWIVSPAKGAIVSMRCLLQ